MRQIFAILGKGSVRLYLLIFLYLLTVFLFLLERSHEREREYLLGRFREFIRLAEEYKEAKESDLIATVSMTSEDLLQRIDSLVDKIGVREMVRYIRTTGSREIKGLTEEGVDIRIDKLTMNEMINLLYGMDSQGLSIKDIRMKKDFEMPERIDLEIKVFMYRPK